MLSKRVDTAIDQVMIFHSGIYFENYVSSSAVYAFEIMSILGYRKCELPHPCILIISF